MWGIYLFVEWEMDSQLLPLREVSKACRENMISQVSFVDFMHAMLTLRGCNKTTVKDIVELRKYIGEEFGGCNG